MTTTNRAGWLDVSRSIDERVEALLNEMTLDEKVAQLGSYWVYQVLENTDFSPEKAQELLANGLGHITRLAGASNLQPAQCAEIANAIQRYMVENTRLGIPVVIHEECCSGYMALGATVFPQAIGIASTWSPEIIDEMGAVIRRQMRSVGAHHALAPVLDVARDARWGRVEETFGEDPYLVSRLGVAYIKGIQGDNWHEGIIATAKHFVGYSMSEGGLNWAPVHMGWRELREVYMLPFEAAIREGKLASVMNAYHELDGVPCGSSRALLTDVLRGEWGFDGTVVSDYFTINMLYKYHHTAPNKFIAAKQSIEAGLDVELPFTDCYGENLRDAVLRGDVDEALVDVSVRRILAQKFMLGLFENPYVDTGAVAFDTPDDRRLAREIAHKSMVLLRNEDDFLPLPKTLARVAVIGPNAGNIRNLFGDYAYPAHIETLLETRHQNSMFDQPIPEGVSSIDNFIETKTVYQAFKDKLGAGVEVTYAQGCDVNTTRTDGFAEAVAAAKAAQVAVVVVGDKAGLMDDCTSGEARDRADLGLPGVQADLVRAVYETGTPVLLVLVNGRPVSLGWMAEEIPAILEAWFPAEEGANAIADIVFGDVNPGGKLPISFPRTAGQIPAYYGHRPSGGRSHWKVDYVETPVAPLYPFGYGLSYTQFELQNLRINAHEVQAGDVVNVTVDVTNVGERAGDEVVQLYTHQYVTGITRPVKELKGFQRVTVEAGQTRTVTIALSVNQLGFYDLDNTFVLAPGIVEIMVGVSSQDIRQTGTIEITGEKVAIADERVYFSSPEVI